ncbi:hypothetical protein HMPREF1303_02029 [Propionibacterium sp. KPL2009]|nr:hypothetical protein HMPREF1303_02029 [Propionibacterium sp. KPL2009]ERS31511.1 hypothetical protein HMPREF1280_02037 [Propionibacterium sp. KPL1854]TLG05500.1 hypothetical protein FD519_08100 [Cutibacterium acnes]TLG31744.1 hypothetical protein FD513_05955 [Cutibacterium acnes]TLG35729.1 hypothetical protein FD512_07565 [Cutibacterium acnes]
MSTGTSTKHLVLARLRRGRRDDAIEPCAVRTGRGMTTTGHCALRLMSQIPTPHNGVGLIVLAVVVVSSWLTPLDGRRTSWHGHG